MLPYTIEDCQAIQEVITKQIGDSIWQRLFYYHIIRDERGYKDIFDHIDVHPLKMDEPVG